MDIKILEKLFDSKLENIHFKLDSIHKEFKDIKGRVNKYEKETEVIRFFSKYPKFLIVIVALFILGTAFKGLESVVSIVKAAII